MAYNISRFSNSCFFKYFEERPLGFIDIGAAGGIYPPIYSAAPLVHCICFEPNKDEANKLRTRYENNKSFAKLTVIENAVGNKAESRKLYITKSSVNSSLLRPKDKIINRYDIEGLQVEKEISIKTISIDELYFDRYQNNRDSFGEFLKIDCQGAEYDVLKGAVKVLEEFCTVIVCEVSFFQVYHSQNIFAEIDLFLRRLGFQLYSIDPKYISTKHLDRKCFDTEERLVTADAIYFKDPLDSQHFNAKLRERNVRALIFSAMITEFFDLAIDLTIKFIEDEKEKKELIQDIKQSALDKKSRFLSSASAYLQDIRNNPKSLYLLAKKFIDHHRNNSSIDFLDIRNIIE